MAPSIFHHCGCQTVSKAELQEAFSALLKSQEPGALYAKPRDPRCELEKSEFCSTHGVLKELLSPQNGSAVRVTHLPPAREAICPKHKGVPCECAMSANLENGFCTSDGSVIEPLEPWNRSATRNKQKRILGGFLAPEEWIRSEPLLALAMLALLLFVVVVFGVSLTAMSVTRRRDTPVTPVTPVTPDIPPLLACPDGWFGYRGVCYFLSKDHRSWNQSQALCSELGASLAVLSDMDMELLFCLSGKDDFWLGLRRQDQGLQWVDGSSFNSSVPVLGNAECVFLADNHFGSLPCSTEMRYICSKAQNHL